ncbi:MAG: serine/threonine protein kinase, partial [Calditrichaeota bacterium]|nr:serine/threonine protein kinase [Calditrichota bacterium]
NVAIKFLPDHIANDSESRERFVNEAKAAAALNHPNIAQIYAIENSEDAQFIVMEYVDGNELIEAIRESPLHPEVAIDYANQIANGLHAAHEKGIIHRDIKPTNIMITGDGQVKIMDFGLAKMADAALKTRQGTTLGTFAYMSPEQAQGMTVDYRTDIWSLGVVFYQMIAGKAPFEGDYEQVLIYAILNES